MMFFLFFISIFSIISCQSTDQQIINIHINEKLPLSTILFTTTNHITYRLFDSGRNQNSFIYYNTSNGHILLSYSLDREYLCSQHICSCTDCQLIIELIEWQRPYQLLKLILNIEDINDQRPEFSSDNYQLNIMENVPIGFELPLEAAHDTDLGENSRINYALQSSRESPFELITKLNGGLALKVIKQIDREERDFYQYELIAFDHGQPQQQSSTKLSIHIDDMNDNPVVLSQIYLHLHISENTPVGTELTWINATDKDTGMNGKIHYSISNGYPSEYFRIGDSTGILILINSLDYESEQFYRLTIQVRDLGENSLARFVTIDISILDENDNSPQASVTFLHPLINNSIISILENTPVGQILAHISISDQDSGTNGEMSYGIEQGKEMIGMKILDQRSFLLVIDHLIDREDENMNVKKLILSISDHGKPERSIRLEYQINILDINDSPPRFNQSMNCNLDLYSSQNQSLDRPLFQVQAIDLDLGDNGLISYLILPPYDKIFMINTQGQVFNFENLNQSSYHLQIMAIDHGKPIQLNSTHDCYISISMNNNLEHLNKPMKITIFKYHYLVFIILILFLMIIGLIFCFYKFLYHHRRCFKPNKTYHLYVSIPRQSLYINDTSPSDHASEEFVHLNSDQSSDKESFSSHHHQVSRTVGNRYPAIVVSSYDSRPVSLAISTATTCTSTETDSSHSTVVQLVEEENLDV